MDTLGAVLDRLIPADGTPGALGCGVDAVVRERVAGLDAWLDGLAGFADLDPEEQDAWLLRIERRGDQVFQQVVRVAHEAFYADPRSWPPLGYFTGVPPRP